MVKISTRPMKKREAKGLRNKLRSNGYKVAMLRVSGGRLSHIVKAER